MVAPWQRRDMAKQAVTQREISIRLACDIYGISETCYRYRSGLSTENRIIADWLLRLTHNQRNWGFGLCFVYLRNVKGFVWNHKRVYRIYRGITMWLISTVNFFNSIKQYLIKSYTIIDVLPLHLRTKMNSEISLVH